jgi:hypothetical protein
MERVDDTTALSLRKVKPASNGSGKGFFMPTSTFRCPKTGMNVPRPFPPDPDGRTQRLRICAVSCLRPVASRQQVDR